MDELTVSGCLSGSPNLNLFQSKQIHRQQQQVQAEHRRQPFQRAIADESEVAEDRDDSQGAHVLHREGQEHESGGEKAHGFRYHRHCKSGIHLLASSEGGQVAATSTPCLEVTRKGRRIHCKYGAPAL
jgi:hypothetical protein